MADINSVTDLVVEGDLAVLTLNSPPVNALSYGVRDGIALGVAEAIADLAVKAVVLICDGRTLGKMRPARGQSGPVARRRRHPAPAAHRRRPEGAGNDDQRPACASQGLPGHGPS